MAWRSTGEFWIADFKLVKLNSALVNVIRTNASDVTIIDTTSAAKFKLGVDFDVVNAPKPNVAAASDLVAAWEQGNRYQIRRRAGGAIAVGQRVFISFDVLGGFVGQVSDGAHCNCFAEPAYYAAMDQMIAWTRVANLLFIYILL